MKRFLSWLLIALLVPMLASAQSVPANPMATRGESVYVTPTPSPEPTPEPTPGTENQTGVDPRGMSSIMQMTRNAANADNLYTAVNQVAASGALDRMSDAQYALYKQALAEAYSRLR